MITETSQCSKRPMKGALRGLLLAQRRENGRIPSRPISCTTGYVVCCQYLYPCVERKFRGEGGGGVKDIHRPLEKITLNTFPKAESATKTERTLSARTPNILRKKVAATICLELMISAFGTAAKYAICKVLVRSTGGE